GPAGVNDAWERCRDLVETLESSFLAVAVVAERPGGRIVLKYSYDIEAPRLGRTTWKPKRPIEIRLPTALLAASHHAEVFLPDDLRITEADLVDRSAAQPRRLQPTRRSIESFSAYHRRDHLAGTEPEVQLDVAVEPRA